MITAFRRLFATKLTVLGTGPAAPVASPAAPKYDIRDPRHPMNCGWRRQDAGQGERHVRYVMVAPARNSADAALRRYLDVWPHTRSRR